jgi:hypothetical protein
MANDLQEYLAKFGCKLNVKVNLVKCPPFYLFWLLTYLLEPCIENSGKFFVNFGQNMAIENLKAYLILALLNFLKNMALWLYMTSKKKKKRKKRGCSCENNFFLF